tara:strand:+ start:395 stop:1156 length:762 start_codon:yes stop_codon:yes gene_type:complete
MSKNLFLLYHLGLGDQIICNGLVRYLYKQYETLTIPAFRHNISTIEKMFSDLDNLLVLPVLNDHEASLIAEHVARKKFLPPWKVCDIFALGGFNPENGLDHTGKLGEVETFDEVFYVQAEVNYLERWKSFYVPPNEQSQKLVLDKLQICDYNNYIFVHDDASRDLNIKSEKLPKLPIVRPDHELGKLSDIAIFDYLEVLKMASEIHCIDSSFAAYIDHVPELKAKKKVIHRYVRKENDNPRYLNNWIIDEDIY